MTKENWVEEVRPVVRLGLAFLLYLRFGNLSGANHPENSPLAMFPEAELFIGEFEKSFKFED